MATISGDELARLRSIGDPDADDYVAALVDDLDPAQRSRWLTHAVDLLRNPTSPVTGWVEDWLSQVVHLPGWADESAIARGQNVFNTWSLDMATALYCSSLPRAYISGRGAAVLGAISELGRLDRIDQRIAVTGGMLLAVTVPGSLAAHESGYRTLRRVRLLHACVRASLMTRDPAWPVDLLGVPINQEDQMGTQLTFTIAVFQGFERLGYQISTEERSDYLHLWGAIGYLLGVQRAGDLIDPATAEALTRDLERRLDVATGVGQTLMKDLVESMGSGLPKPLRHFPAAMVRHLSGDRIADLLDVPPSRWVVAIGILTRLDRFVSRFASGRRALRLPSRVFGRAVLARKIARSSFTRDGRAYWPDQFVRP